MNVHNRGLALGFQGKDLKLDLFSQAEENLFIDLLIKADEEAREKSKKNDINFGEEEVVLGNIFGFLIINGKVGTSQLSPEEQRQYMELKFDSLEANFIGIDEKKLCEYLKKDFPLESLTPNYQLTLEDLRTLFIPNFGNEKNNNYKKFLSTSYIKSIGSLDEIDDNIYIVYPLLIPKFEESINSINWTLRKHKIDIGFQERRKMFQQDNILKSFLNSFLLFRDDPTPYLDDIIAEVFPKTNIFCDYRWIEPWMLEGER